MKNTSIIFVLALFLALFGCEVSSDNVATDLGKKDQVLFSIDSKGLQKNVTISPDIPSPINARVLEGEVSVKGHMDWFPNDNESTWKESVNAYGNATTGSGQIEIHTSFWGTIHGTVLCTYAEGNEAVVGFYVTNVKESLTAAFTKGKIIYIRLIDNGEGSKSSPDQHFNTIYYTPFEFESIEDAQTYINNSLSCSQIFALAFGFSSDIYEGNFQIK